ncbi:MAG: ABC transporter permease [Promethearchaeota archaeon]
MTINLDNQKKVMISKIFEVFKFELILHKKRYILMMTLSLVVICLISIFSIFYLPSEPRLFAATTVGELGSFIMLLSLFFAGGILADEFDKKTALTNFTKTSRDNFFIGKTLAAYFSVIIWIGPALIETSIFSLILYNHIPVELFIWFGYYSIVGGAYTAIYLLCSAIFRSGGQAMTIGFVIFIVEAAAFGILLAFINFPYPFILYCELPGQAIFGTETDGIEIIIDPLLGISIALLYLIPCILIAYLRFKVRDV